MVLLAKLIENINSLTYMLIFCLGFTLVMYLKNQVSQIFPVLVLEGKMKVVTNSRVKLKR